MFSKYYMDESGYVSPNKHSPNDRLVAVISPEDREQVERLAQAYLDKFGGGHPAEAIADQMQAALREFANPKPPKPDEPTGLGAVVEDADGVLWVRTDHRISTSHRNPWIRQDATGTGSDKRHWLGVDAVRVLSEGVSE